MIEDTHTMACIFHWPATRLRPRWFAAEANLKELQKFVARGSQVAKELHVLDLFGCSGRMREAFEHQGMKGLSYDIKLSKAHDITTEAGFRYLLRKSWKKLDVKNSMLAFFVGLCMIMHGYAPN